jgi:hypothetical protein
LTDPSFREALLRQDKSTSVGEAVEVLQKLVAGEEQRMRRLKLGTIVVYGLWTAIAIAYLAVGFTRAVKAPELPPGAVIAPLPAEVASAPILVNGPVGILLLFVGFLCLPAVVMTPLFLIFLSGRTASMGQVRSSLASIEEQLKLLAQTTQMPPPDAPG